MKYKLNPKKTTNKKIEACKRDLNIEIELKKGTLVMTLVSGAYELFKEAILQYYDKSTTRTCSITNKSSRFSGQNINKLIVEESLSVNSNTGENRNKQLFRINMFHTTSRIDVNGKGHQEFIETDLPNIIKLMNTYGMNALNEKIVMFCNTYMYNPPPLHGSLPRKSLISRMDWVSCAGDINLPHTPFPPARSPPTPPPPTKKSVQ
jgi:hypothetical protein